MSGDWMLAGGALALFGALFVMMLAVTGPRVRRRRLARELATDSEASSRSQMSAFGAKATALAERQLARHDHNAVVASTLERAGVDMRAPEFAVIVTVAAAVAAALGALIAGPIMMLVFAGLTVGGFVAGLHVKASKRRKAFEDQLPDALGLIAGALRAGHSLPQALDALVHEAQAPTSDEFRRALFEVQLGHSLADALRALAARVRSDDFDWVVQAIEIQHEVGGDLAAVLDNVTRTIRDRTRVRRQIDTLTAEGRLSAVILMALPIGMFLFMSVANPSYTSELTGSVVGIVMLSVAGGLMVVGALWLRRIIRLVY